MTKTTWHIEIRDKWGNWQLDHVGDENEYGSKDDAWDAVEDLRELGDEWVDAEYRVVKRPEPIYVCEKCGSDRIRQTVYVWYNSIEECGHRAETEHEEPTLWCANCNSREKESEMKNKNVSCCLPEIDIRQLCTYCGRDTAWHAGNGLFVDRIPSDSDGKLVLSGGDSDIDTCDECRDCRACWNSKDVTIDVVINGYICVDCQTHTCDGCGTPTHEYEILDKATPEKEGE